MKLKRFVFRFVFYIEKLFSVIYPTGERPMEEVVTVLNVSLVRLATHSKGLWFWNTMPQMRHQKVHSVRNGSPFTFCLMKS